MVHVLVIFLMELSTVDGQVFRKSVDGTDHRHLHASCWTAPIADFFTDVDVSCSFPPESVVTSAIHEREANIVKISSDTFITPEMSHLEILVLPDDAEAADLESKDVSEILVPHNDSCAGRFQPKSGADVYNNIKAYVDTFDIYTMCTKVYVPNQVNGVPKMRKDDVIAIVTEPFPGHFTLSYEDVAQYEEYIDSENTKTLIAIITSRKENVIEGNYDVKVQLFANQTVRLAYTKRQNLAERILDLGISHTGYVIATQDSVDRTMLKLAYAGRYGPEALDENLGCYVRKYCTDYFTLAIGEACNYDRQCSTGKCQKTNSWCLWSCNYECAAP
jgi:hypothetical protein